MSHKNNSPNLTKRSTGLLKTDGQSVYLNSLVVSIHGRPQASNAAIFQQSSGHVFSIQSQRH